MIFTEDASDFLVLEMSDFRPISLTYSIKCGIILIKGLYIDITRIHCSIGEM